MSQYPYGNFRDNPPGLVHNPPELAHNPPGLVFSPLGLVHNLPGLIHNPPTLVHNPNGLVHYQPGLVQDPMFQQQCLAVSAPAGQPDCPIFYSSGGYDPALVSSNFIAPAMPTILSSNPFYSNFCFPPPPLVNNTITASDASLSAYQPMYRIPLPQPVWQPGQPCLLPQPHVGHSPHYLQEVFLPQQPQSVVAAHYSHGELASQHRLSTATSHPTQPGSATHTPPTKATTHQKQSRAVTHYKQSGAATYQKQSGAATHYKQPGAAIHPRQNRDATYHLQGQPPQHVHAGLFSQSNAHSPNISPESYSPEPTNEHSPRNIPFKQGTNQKVNRPSYKANTQRDLYFNNYGTHREPQHNQSKDRRVKKQTVKQNTQKLEKHAISEEQNGTEQVQNTYQKTQNENQESSVSPQVQQDDVNEIEQNGIQLQGNGSDEEEVILEEEIVTQKEHIADQLENVIQEPQNGITEEHYVIQSEKQMIQLESEVVQELQGLQLVDAQLQEKRNKTVLEPRPKSSHEEGRQSQHTRIEKKETSKQQWQKNGKRQFHNYHTPSQNHQQFNGYQDGRNQKRQPLNNQPPHTPHRENPASSSSIGNPRKTIQVTANTNYIIVSPGLQGKRPEHGLINGIRNIVTPPKHDFGTKKMVNGLNGGSRYFGHAGVRGTYRADILAESAIVGDGQAIDRVDSQNAIRDARKEADSFGEQESVSKSRLNEHQVKRDVAKLEIVSVSQRRIVNQHRTGIVSRYRLRDLLKTRSKHLWTMFDVK